MNSFIVLLILFSIISHNSIYAQSEKPTSKKLPFEISEKQKISQEDLKSKSEGWNPLFIPILFRDETLGAGYGLTISYINNGKKDNPLFEYSPYRDALSITVANSTKGMQLYYAEYSKKYINDTPYSIHISGGYEKIANALYFGIGNESMNPLSGRFRNQPENEIQDNLTFERYEDNLAFQTKSRNNSKIGQYETFKMYNRYSIESPYFDTLTDRIFYGLYKFAAGITASRPIIRTYDNSVYESPDPYFHNTVLKIKGTGINADSNSATQHGRTKLSEDNDRKKIKGFSGGYVNLFRVGIAYDTRDFSLDPNRGVLLEVTHELSRKAFGSDFHFNKTFAQVKLFTSPAPNVFKKLVIAGRVAYGYTTNEAPFFSYSNYNGTDSYLVGLGGASTLRGYQLSRFVGPVIGLANLEIRWKFSETTYRENHFTFHLIPFFDTGRIWEHTKETDFKGYARSYGMGFQISYNLSTILRFDFAKSNEDSTFNFQMAQPF